MDPYSSEGELLNLHNHFYQGNYTSVLTYDTSSISATNALAARIFLLRSRIALGQCSAVASELTSESTPDLAAVRALAEFKSGNAHAALATIEGLAEKDADNTTVQVVGATVLQLAGKSDEALALLAKHQGNLEAVALTVQIHLVRHRTDLALREIQTAKKWAQDSLLANLAESWVGLRVGGDRYQQAYYVYEELAQTPGSSTVATLVGQAVAELHLGRIEEAETAFGQAVEKALSAETVDNEVLGNALANWIVLLTVAGRTEEWEKKMEELRAKCEGHQLLRDLEEKSSLFDAAKTKYSPKVTA